MKKIILMLGLGALAGLYAGDASARCTELGCPSEKKAAEKKVEDIVKTECQIREVQSSSISIIFGTDTAMQHDFVYFTCVNPEKTLTLVYPSSRMIRRGVVDVRYKPLEKDGMTSAKFVEEYVKTIDAKGKVGSININYPGVKVDYFQIYADGIIVEDGLKEGLKYK
jgi:hypothetical protein